MSVSSSASPSSSPAAASASSGRTETLGPSFPGVAMRLVLSASTRAEEGDRELDAEEGWEGDSITVLPVMGDEAVTMDAGTMGTMSASVLLASSTSLGLVLRD